MATNGKQQRSRTDAGALRRGLRILQALQQVDDAGLKVAEIAQVTGLPRPTVYRLLDVLVNTGFLRTVDDGRRYASVSATQARRRDAWGPLVRRLTPALRRIAQSTGNSVFLVRRADADSLCLHREFGWHPIQVNSIEVGGRQPLGVGAAGLALLAAHPPEEVEVILARSAGRLPSYGGLTATTLRRLVANTRERGHSVVANYAVRGILGVGVALHDRTGKPLVAVSVTSTIERMSTAQQRRVADLIRAELGVVGSSFVSRA